MSLRYQEKVGRQISTAQLSLQPPCGLTMLSRVDLVGQSMGSIAPRFQALQRVLTPVDELETVPVPSRKVDSKKSASIEDVFEIDLERERKQSPVSCLTYGLLEDVFASSACDDAVTKANEVVSIILQQHNECVGLASMFPLSDDLF